MVAKLDWPAILAAIDANGYAMLPRLLDPAHCAALTAMYDEDRHFRKRVVMGQHGFGRGEYKYFNYPLPDPVAALRTSLYPPLAQLANRWNVALGIESSYSTAHTPYLDHCHAAGQTRATPLLLRYGAGDYNRMHQDLCGEEVFPLQATFLLSAPGQDFTGGEFILAEQRPRQQSRAEVVPLRQGDGVIFAVNHRPVRGARGFYRTAMRHGVSTVRSGHRMTLGIIFHDG